MKHPKNLKAGVGVCIFVLAVLALFCRADLKKTQNTYAEQRNQMVEEQIKNRGVSDSRVLDAMREVPRHLFIDEPYRHLAYADHPLPIQAQQTISQPYIVGLMTEAVQVQKGDKVLEVGTGSGYQAAVLAHLTVHVYSIEIIKELAEKARQTLKKIGYDQVKIKWGDGNLGWEEHAPYDAIIVTAASRKMPPALFEQLKEGGLMVIPIGNPSSFQILTLIEKKQGKPVRKEMIGVRFVPMTERKR
ncbi:MAG: protein-L-isoaspartate(D-aspartate) O-methyltransferase [Candidatus Aminicenantes bacterium]|nr:protein-L-isoaspartate(D-aspartate) O-methyltransferase [Candidatus Aminicenantes bacterium]